MKKELLEKINYYTNNEENSKSILKLIVEFIKFDYPVTGDYMIGYKDGINQIKKELE